jgi:protein phosphatase
VGDSRCYLLRKGELQQVTVDHTLANILAETGKMDRDEARRSPMGHALWNAIGGKSDDLSVDVYKLSLQRDDTLLLCTDGLYDMVPEEELAQILRTSENAETSCRKLVELANANGGNDNVTAIVANFLTPKVDEPRAFVEAEVPLEMLTEQASDTGDTTVNLRRA